MGAIALGAAAETCTKAAGTVVGSFGKAVGAVVETCTKTLEATGLLFAGLVTFLEAETSELEVTLD